MEAPTISIVVCSYNSANMLEDALDCMESQEVGGPLTIELLVVDDGSTDSTLDMLSARVRNVSIPLRIVQAGGRGVSHARNLGISESQGEWIAWFDQDQLAEPNWLNALYEVAQATGADWVDGPRELHLPQEELEKLSLLQRYTLGELYEGNEPHEIRRRYASCTGNALVRRSVFECIGGFDEAIRDGWEDWDILRRVRVQGFTCWYAPEARVRHVIPEERLCADHMYWHSTRLGIAFASRDAREWGRGATVGLCIARLAQGLLVHLPLYFAAWILRDRTKRETRRMFLLRLVGYIRRTLYLASPRLFAQDLFFERMHLRRERRYAPSSEKPQPQGGSLE